MTFWTGRKSHEEHVYVKSFEAPDAKILVVDDTAANLMVVSKLLRETKVNLVLVSSGPEALEKTLEDYYHVILMDHKMPGMDGIECMHAIRTQTGGLCRDSKIIALTANAGSDTKDMYFREGFDGYLMKPVTGEELENTVYHALPKEIVTVTGTAQTLEDQSTAWVTAHKKKERVKVTTDSIADIPEAFLERFNIAQIPHMVKTSHGLFKDGLEIDTDGLLSFMADPNEVAETLSPSVEEYTNFFMKNIIIGTAGHVDHGKTTLIKALSGIDTDRLEEEKKRGITIELGFAHIPNDAGYNIGVIDVPGHEKFIKHMLAGIGGIDFVLFVVAADEGIMPQTREHFEILQALGINDGIIAVTKTDMVEDEWLEMLLEEVDDYFRGSFLEGKPVIPVSAATGDNIDVLKEAIIDKCDRENKRREEKELFRLPVDRVFSMQGFGTVVTGTLIDGTVKTGEDVIIEPKERKPRSEAYRHTAKRRRQRSQDRGPLSTSPE